jgi:hypothetical protein
LLLSRSWSATRLLSVFESRNTARLEAPPGIASKGNLMYLAAPPNSTSLLFAAEFLFRTDNISAPNPAWLNISHSLHGDQHAIALASSTNWYVGNDGGAWATTNRGDAWTSLNDNLRTLEMFSADAPRASAAMAGGAGYWAHKPGRYRKRRNFS